MRKVLQDEADLVGAFVVNEFGTVLERLLLLAEPVVRRLDEIAGTRDIDIPVLAEWVARVVLTMVVAPPAVPPREFLRSEEHTSELQSLMRNSYAVFCLKKKNKKKQYTQLI